MTRIAAYLHNVFLSFYSRIQLSLGEIGFELVKCAKAGSFVETLGSHADTLHSWIDRLYEQDLRGAFEKEVRRAAKLLGVSVADLVFDFTSEPFYGRTTTPHVFGVQGEAWRGEFKYLVVSMVRRNKSIPLMALPIVVGEGVAKPTIALYLFCQTLFRKIRTVKLDRGFYCSELIDFLNSQGVKYLMLCPEKDGAIADYVSQTETLGKFRHPMRYRKDKSTWMTHTTIVVCKGIDDYSWIFATNMHFKTRCEYIWHYKRRWQIETNFRIEDEAKIKTKTTKYLTRYFYFLISLLLHLFWTIDKNINTHHAFKKYLDIIEDILREECSALLKT